MQREQISDIDMEASIARIAAVDVDGGVEFGDLCPRSIPAEELQIVVGNRIAPLVYGMDDELLVLFREPLEAAFGIGLLEPCAVAGVGVAGRRRHLESVDDEILQFGAPVA